MRKYTIATEVTVCELNELAVADRELVEQAMQATDHSYSPYSHFRVGAALRLADGQVVTGSNQENAAFGNTMCAERTAIFHAQHAHPELAPTTLAVAARTETAFTSFPIPPCGACRQSVLELEDRYQAPVRVLLYGTDGVHCFHTIKELLPLQFVSESMD